MLFEEFAKSQPLLSMMLFSFIISLLLTFIYKALTNQQRIKELRDLQKDLQMRLKGEKDQQKMMGIQKEMLEKSAELMKITMKPTFVTFIPLLLVFIFLKQLYTAAKVGDLISWGVNLPLVGTGAGWLLSYVLFSLIFSISLRKILKIH
jgi:uncharacterized membrane protein (DUF106 family)